MITGNTKDRFLMYENNYFLCTIVAFCMLEGTTLCFIKKITFIYSYLEFYLCTIFFKKILPICICSTKIKIKWISQGSNPRLPSVVPAARAVPYLSMLTDCRTNVTNI